MPRKSNASTIHTLIVGNEFETPVTGTLDELAERIAKLGVGEAYYVFVGLKLNVKLKLSFTSSAVPSVRKPRAKKDPAVVPVARVKKAVEQTPVEFA